MLDQNRKPGMGIGRGRGILKTTYVDITPNSDELKNKSKMCLDKDDIICSNENDSILLPKRVIYVPNDDIEDYKLHVNSGNNFSKFNNIKVNVTGVNVPPTLYKLSDLNAANFLSENICKMGFRTLTAVQKYTIPIISVKRDVMVCAETGSGKTAAFLIPILNILWKLKDGPKSTRNCPYCIVIVPSRELCRQIYTVAVELSRTSSIKCSYGYGGVEMLASLNKLIDCDILFVTPGRLLQYLNSDIILLNRLEFLVLDEADKLLAVDSFHEVVQLVVKVARIINNRDLHISMFSATFPREIQSLAQKYLIDYLFVAVGIVGAANSDIIQTLIPVTGANKLDITLEYISNHKLGKTLIFVCRKRLADFYGIRLIEMGLKTTTIHGDRDQKEREAALNDFKSGRVEVLVATDVASRGLDIPYVDTVINIDMPHIIDIYVHRIGRSGRCGNPGSAVSFFNVDTDSHIASGLVRILKCSRQKCPEFLIKLAQGGGKVDHDTMIGSRSDLRHEIYRPCDVFSVPKNFMNMTEESEEEDF